MHSRSRKGSSSWWQPWPFLCALKFIGLKSLWILKERRRRKKKKRIGKIEINIQNSKFSNLKTADVVIEKVTIGEITFNQHTVRRKISRTERRRKNFDFWWLSLIFDIGDHKTSESSSIDRIVLNKVLSRIMRTWVSDLRIMLAPQDDHLFIHNGGQFKTLIPIFRKFGKIVGSLLSFPFLSFPFLSFVARVNYRPFSDQGHLVWLHT